MSVLEKETVTPVAVNVATPLETWSTMWYVAPRTSPPFDATRRLVTFREPAPDRHDPGGIARRGVSSLAHRWLLWSFQSTVRPAFARPDDRVRSASA